MLDSAISSLRAALAAGALGRPSDVSTPGTVIANSSGGIHGGEIPAGAFLSKSIPEAAKLYLSIVKAKKTTREIADALRKGGIETTSTNFENIVHAGLNRAMKIAGGFLRVGRAWALPEWYPAGIRSSSQERREKPKSRKVRKKAKGPMFIKRIEASAAPESPSQKLSDRVLELLSEGTNLEFTAKELSESFGVNAKVMAMMMGTLLKKGRVAMSAPGTYRAAKK
jgi:hypothetical protein